MQIQLIVKKAVNFTPSALMRRWALANNAYYGTGKYFQSFLRIRGKEYVFDHWDIKLYKEKPGYDIVTLFLEEKR